MDPELDREDVERVLAGDLDGFAPIVGRWQRPLVNLAYRFCGNRAEAEEMAQEAFLKAFRSLRRWRRESAFSTWLFALATNHYRSWLRRRRPVTVPLDALADLASSERAGERLERRERERLVRAAVRSLPTRYRDALVLFYFHDMDVGQAAASLRLPEGTLKSHLHRARALLKRRFPDLGAAAAVSEEEERWTTSTGFS